MKRKKQTPKKEQLTVQQQINRRTFVSFTAFTAIGAAMVGGWRWLYHSATEPAGGVTGGARKPLRRVLNKNELFWRNLFDDGHEVKTYPKNMAAQKVRVNGNIGIDDKDFDAANWKLELAKDNQQLLSLSLDEIKKLPKTEIVFDFKCVEGWDQIQHWAGVRFSDFLAHHNLQELQKMQYVGMATPNGNYYVGLDMASALHPQTLLAYEMNGAPLLPEHGAPLRLIIPVKYGIKNLKRIGTITFSNERPRDYWAQEGYDYYSGL